MATVTARTSRRRNAPATAPVRESRSTRARSSADDYWVSTRRPFVCLVFLAPLLIVYELGVLWLGDGREELLRNGADAWMRSWLYAAGIQYSFALPLVVIGLLLLWNFYGDLRWKVRLETLGGMLAESLIFAVALVAIGQSSELLWHTAGLPTASIDTAVDASATPAEMSVTDDLPSPRRTVARAVTFVGAGIYEEVLFRLLLLPACYSWFRLLQAGPKASAVLAVTATSLLFALAHYIGPAGDALVPYTFCFRATAGAFFAALFMARGFGITVGTHAAYDLIVGVLWVM